MADHYPIHMLSLVEILHIPAAAGVRGISSFASTRTAALLVGRKGTGFLGARGCNNPPASLALASVFPYLGRWSPTETNKIYSDTICVLKTRDRNS